MYSTYLNMYYSYERFCLHLMDFELLRVLSVVKSYFLKWFMNSEKAKVLHVGDEWMNILCSRIMGLKLVECCWNIKVLCQYCNVYYCRSLSCFQVAIVLS